MPFVVGVTFDVAKVHAMSRARGYPVDDEKHANSFVLARIVSATLDDYRKYPHCLAFDNTDGEIITVVSLDGGSIYETSEEASATLLNCSIPDEWKSENPQWEWLSWLADKPAVFGFYEWIRW
ncbi:hypothetical protein CYLTODRAFT_440513 [Cylindrobasidium torrendii FP15055 ss-10]|uniref:Uncharacterized protein n=1 Tax=Cylindrobasidium torrendii FP15055 ss-10 TaxID=1314674 RepID=A0A0D7BQ89_9AGAR|nr:hypothetical protein CYLTODRAFT_440513 [Cylindrobasidium torrendii FP15055 ss-10]